MKTLSLVQSIELPFSGNLLKEAICIGDCDNDGFGEIVVGNTDGELYIYRSTKCIFYACDLGCISAISIGDLLNVSKNVIVVVTAEGWCHIFDVCDVETGSPALKYVNPPDKSDKDCFDQQSAPPGAKLIVPFHSQRIVCNTKIVLLGDVNLDNCVEMVVSLTDRVVRTYRWKPERRPSLDQQGTSKKEREDVFTDKYDGRLYAINKWEFAHQIGSATLYKHGNLVSILLSHPGGTVSQITELSATHEKSDDGANLDNKQDSSLKSGNSLLPNVDGTSNTGGLGSGISSPMTEGQRHHPSILRDTSTALGDNIVINYCTLDVSHMRNPNITTEVAANITSFDSSDNESYAVCTVDGSVLICKNDTIEWSFQVDHQILSVLQYKGKLVFVGWEGDTYIIDRTISDSMDKNIKRFCFEENVAAFSVGSYGIVEDVEDGSTALIARNCMVYVTFDQKIYVYPTKYL